MKALLLFFVFLFSQLQAERSTICLNMIVKDESRVIERCLNSAKPLIDYWVIVDTGSSDNTIEIIKETLKGIPGELHQCPWENFEVNRNQALALAKGKGDYVLFIDADEVFSYAEGFSFSNLDKDFYLFNIQNEVDGRIASEYQRILLVDNRLDWKWKGVIHEDIYCVEARRSDLIKGIYNISRTQEGARAQDPQKYLKDAAVLEKALKSEPNNTRYIYYLAASYYNSGVFDCALPLFQRRIDLEPNNWQSDEIYNSLYFIGCMQAAMGLDQRTVVDTFTKAHLYNPSRPEPLYQLGAYLIDQNSLLLADCVLRKALSLTSNESSPGTKYAFTWICDWGILHKFAECAFKLGHYQEAKEALQILIMKPLPPDLLAAMRNNLQLLQ